MSEKKDESLQEGDSIVQSFNGTGLSESVVFRKKKTGIFEFKKK